MPSQEDQQVLERARQDESEGKSPSTQAGEFVREEIDHVREGKHGVRNTKQAIAIGLSKARRAGIKLPAPRRGSAEVRRRAESDSAKGRNPRRPVSAKRSRAAENALKREGHSAGSRRALSVQGRQSARERGPASRRKAAAKAARTRRRNA
jgi:hypothetical protein